MDYSKKRKRINYSVKTQMQIRLFFKFLIVALTGVGVMAVIFYLYSNRAINESYKQFHMHAQNFLDLLVPAIILSLLSAIVIAVLITLFLPIKYAGPLFRIERDLREKVGEGNLAVRFHLRKGDEVGDLAESINSCLEKLGQTIAPIKESATAVAARLDTIAELPEDVREGAQKIKSGLDQFILS